MLMTKRYPQAETHRELKEALYYQVIDYFDKGKVQKHQDLFVCITDMIERWHFS